MGICIGAAGDAAASGEAAEAGEAAAAGEAPTAGDATAAGGIGGRSCMTTGKTATTEIAPSLSTEYRAFAPASATATPSVVRARLFRLESGSSLPGWSAS